MPASVRGATLSSRSLPIAQGRDALVREIRGNAVTILVGETGSGKTTQVPQYLLDFGIAGNGIIAVTQPRRVAAISLASRVAAERRTVLGTTVGYSVRFDDVCSPQTRIKYLTDGMITRELLSDPLLLRYSVVIIDEAHERTLRTDLLLANLKRIQQERDTSEGNSLKLVIMSATLDAEKFSKFLNGAQIIYIAGRQYPVSIFHTAESQADYIDATLRAFFQVHIDQPPGDVLIFLPGREDIDNLARSIQIYANRLPSDRMWVAICPVYAALPPGQQTKIFLPVPPNVRKCILATNIAETSITIPGVKYVIDTGKCKEKRFLSQGTASGFDTLLTRDITKSSAMQRAGRAGREGNGLCFRLYTEAAYDSMSSSAEPEIRRLNLTSSYLQLKCFGQDLDKLELLDKPQPDAVICALKTLWLLGALDSKKSLTELGREMAFFPLEPCYARAILASREHGCTSDVLDIISVLSASSPLFIDAIDLRDSTSDGRQTFYHPAGDHLTILNAVKSYRDLSQVHVRGSRKAWCREHSLNERTLTEAARIRKQLSTICADLGIDGTLCSDEDELLLKCLGHGLIQNTAFLQQDGSYRQIMSTMVVKIHPSSTLCNKKLPVIMYDELVCTSQIYARGVSNLPKNFFETAGIFKCRLPFCEPSS